MICPKCGADCWRDEVDVGIGVMHGPYGCICGWSESERFDVSEGPKTENSHRVDQWGGLTPWRRNVHCSNCGDTRGGPVGHEISECTYRHESTTGSNARETP